MEVDNVLTKDEIQTRKWWVRILFASVLFSVYMLFFLEHTNLATLSFAVRFLGVFSGAIFAYIYYTLCYKKQTTFLLSFSLVGFWFSLFVNAALFLSNKIEIDPFLGISTVMGTVSYIFTRRLRHFNKAIKGYKKYPDEVSNVATLIQDASSKEELERAFVGGVKKWPHLKWVLRREKKIRADIL
jgi:cobalamin synthase